MADKQFERVAVCSRSFSANEQLVSELSCVAKEIRLCEASTTLAGDELVEFLTDCDAAIIGLEVLTDQLIRELTTIRVISKYGVGLDKLDLESLEKHGIVLEHQPGVNKYGVAELAVAMMLAWAVSLSGNLLEGKQGTWRKIKNRRLSSCNVGIIGYGNIGRAVGEILAAFKSRTRFFDTNTYLNGIEGSCSSLDELLVDADIVTIHIPLNKNNRLCFGASQLSLMKHDACLVNTSRGFIVDEIALLDWLTRNPNASAYFDVLAMEAPGLNYELLSQPNFYCTPHVGGSAAETILEMGRASIDGLKRHT